MANEITSLTATELNDKLQNREISATEVAKAYLNAIESKNDSLGAYLTTHPDITLQTAEEAQKLIDAGDAPLFAGVPIAVKDNISTKGIKTTCASKLLENYEPVFDATVIKRIKKNGMVMLGKTNLDEFAMGASNETSAFFPAKNPWDLTRSPGGSSGGSAAAVAGNLAPLAFGSDTGGSIRQPASFCGITGFKPSYGRCSRYGLIAYGSSLDQIGPFAKCVEDAAKVAHIVTGHDHKEDTSQPLPPIDYTKIKDGSLKGLKFAIPSELYETNAIEDGVKTCFKNMLDNLQKAGATIDVVHIPTIELGVSTYYVIATAEASSNLARFDGIRFGSTVQSDGHVNQVAATRGKLFGREVKERIMMGTYVLSADSFEAYYIKAQKIRAVMVGEMDGVLDKYNAIISPASPVTAFKIGEKNNDPVAMKIIDLCTIPANMGGYPAISLPCGFSNGLPLGMQIMTKRLDDEKALEIAYSIEREFNLKFSPEERK